MPLTTDQVRQLASQGPLSTSQVQTLATPPVSTTPTTPTITASSLEPKTARQPFTTPPETPIPDLSYLTPKEPTLPNPANTPSTLGTTETQYKNMLAELMGANTALEGKAGYTAQQNEALGVNAASDAITGLNSQLTGLINESKAIPLQIQQSAQEGGANVTKGGLAPIQTASLRNNAIQSLSVSSQIDAMNGQLSNAIKKVDRAVALKYADLEARSATLTKNLELLAKDPSLTLEQQDRVSKKLVEQKAYDAQLADQKQTETETHDARLKVLSNNTGNPKLTQQIIEVLQSAQTPEEVAALVNYLGLSTMTQQDKFKQDLDTAKFQQEQQKMDEDTRQFNATYKQNQEKIDKVAESAGLTPYQVFTATQSIAKDNQKRTENAREISRQVNMMDTAYKNFINGGDKNTASQAIISTFNKILDPTSVVRESEYDRTAAGQSLISRIEGKYNNISQGGAGVTKETLKSAVDLGNEYLKNAQASILKENERSTEMARQFGLDPSFVSSVSTPQEQVTQTTGNIVVAPDGTEIEIID